jgi:hypothetical protein
MDQVKAFLHRVSPIDKVRNRKMDCRLMSIFKCKNDAKASAMRCRKRWAVRWSASAQRINVFPRDPLPCLSKTFFDIIL